MIENVLSFNQVPFLRYTRFYSNADEYFKIIRLNNLLAISVAVEYFTNFNKDIFIFL